MNLIYKCKLIIYNHNERKLVEINSILGVTKKEIKNIYISKNYHIEKFIINNEDFIYNHLKNKGYTVYNIYIPVSKSRRPLDDFYGADIDNKHLFLGYNMKEVKTNLSKLKHINQ